MTTDWHEIDAASAYVAGTLPSDALDGFEEHLLTCERCRAEVRLGAGARRALAGQAGVRRRRRPAVVAAFAIAAVLLVAVVQRERGRSALLAQIDPPRFEGVEARSLAASSDSSADLGMRAYVAGDYAAAASHLAVAAKSDSSPGVAFYLGVSLALTDKPGDAITAFARAQSPVGNPYADDAVVFSAKSWVALGRRDSALAVLARSAASTRNAARLNALADSLRAR